MSGKRVLSGKREYGDYQTPQGFADLVCRYLLKERDIHPDVVIEPACGTGSFLKSSLIFNARQYYGIEISPEYCRICKQTMADACNADACNADTCNADICNADTCNLDSCYAPRGRVEIINADIFTYDLSALPGNGTDRDTENDADDSVGSNAGVLVIGNPPWVESSTQTVLGSGNVPGKSNFKGLRGIDAMTGPGDFDICENIILRLLDAYKDTNAVIAMLCKTSVARNVFKELKRRHICFKYCDIIEFNAAKVFGISASACLLLIRLMKVPSLRDIQCSQEPYAPEDNCSHEEPCTPEWPSPDYCMVYMFADEALAGNTGNTCFADNAHAAGHRDTADNACAAGTADNTDKSCAKSMDPVASYVRKTGCYMWRNNLLYRESCQQADAVDLDGRCCFVWRQGVKHDCCKVMELELKPAPGREHVPGHGQVLVNGYGEAVDIEQELVFPLVKSSMYRQPVIRESRKFVIVTQHKAGEDTSYIEHEYPKAWRYLNSHRGTLDSRRSSIYRGKPAFSMFGVGDYSYTPYKVGVSGFYKTLLFSVLAPQGPDAKPVMTDDTCYFICLPSYDTAYTAMLYLNSNPVQSFLKSISFPDAKRPYPKKVLERLDFSKVCAVVHMEELLATEQRLGLEPRICSAMLEEFIALPEMRMHAESIQGMQGRACRT